MFLTDDPIQKIEDDELGRIAFVEELAQSLLARDLKESLVVSLDGPWGSGKSSVLNLLETKLESSQTALIRFDPWYFNSPEKLLQTFLGEINRILEKKTTGNGLSKAISKYKKVLTSVQVSPKVSFMGVELSLGNLDVEIENPDKLQKEIKQLVKDTKTRVVVLIDNLDRLDLSELLLIFKLVRLCGDFPGFTFVLALDKQQILRLLTSKELSAEFIEKIIQVDIKLPSTEQVRIDNFVFKGLAWIADTRKINLDEFFLSRFSQIYHATVSSKLIGTLRDAKRFLNTADFSLPIVQGEVDYADFLVLQIIRVFFRDVYEFLPQFKSELTKFEILTVGADWHRKEKIAVFSELNEKVKECVKEDSKIVNDLLGFLFPNYRDYISNPQNPSIHTYTNEYEKHQLIASHTHFDRYFTMKVAGDDIPTSAILEFVNWLNDGGDKVDFYEQFISCYVKSNNLALAFKKLDLYAEKLNDSAKLHIVNSVVDNSGIFGRNVHYWNSEIDGAKKLITNCILNFSPEMQIEMILKVISSSQSLLFSMLMAQDGRFGRWFSFTDDTRKIFVETCKSRVYKDLIEEKVNVFETYPDTFPAILRSWGNKDFLDEGDLSKQYLKELLDNNPAYAIKILSLYVWVYAGSGAPSEFAFGDFIARYDLKEINDYLDKIDFTDLVLSEKESFAVKEFRRLYNLKMSESKNE